MGGCSSKPQTSECEGHIPANELLLSGLKAIDPSNPSHYKGSQHTLQSLFIQHHRDGDELLENAQTLQELLLDPKTLPNFENESAGNAEAELASKDLQHELGSACKHSSPTSVLPDPPAQHAASETKVTETATENNAITVSALAEQNAEPCPSSESPAKETTVANLADLASNSAETQTQNGPIAASAFAERSAEACPSSEPAASSVHGTHPQPNADALPSPEPNLSRSICTDQVFHETRVSEAMKVAASDPVQAADVQEPTRLGGFAPDCKILGTEEEHAMEVPKETNGQSEMELYKAEQAMGAYTPELQHEKTTQVVEYEASQERKEAMGTSELGVVQHDDNCVKPCLQGEKAIECSTSQTTEKGIDGGNEELLPERVTEGEKRRVQDTEYIESEKAGMHNEGVIESGRERMQMTEEEMELGTGQECEKEEEFMLELVLRVPDGCGKEETAGFEKAATVQHGETAKIDVGFQNNEETEVQDERELSEQKANKDHGQAENEIHSPSQVPLKETCVEATSSGLIEKSDSGEEKLASTGSATGADIEHTVIKEPESDEKTINGCEHIQKDELTGYLMETVTMDSMKVSKLGNRLDGLESLGNESSRLPVSEEVLAFKRNEKFEHEHSPSDFELYKKAQDQVAPELSLLQDNKGDGALLQKSLLEDAATDSLESSRVEPSVELQHGTGDAVDNKAKLEESMEVDTLVTKAQEGQSGFFQSSDSLKSDRGYIEEPSIGLNPIIPCPMKTSADVFVPEAKEFDTIEDKKKVELGTTKPDNIQREGVEATTQLENL